jgi:hypothetical protein
MSRIGKDMAQTRTLTLFMEYKVVQMLYRIIWHNF